jgi:hypothetical protein
VITTFYTCIPLPRALFGYCNPKEWNMKKSLLIAALALLALGGCVAVPVYDSGPGYGYDYYGPPAATFSFGYVYRDGDRWHGPRHRNYRHRY